MEELSPLLLCRWTEQSWWSLPLTAPCHRRGNTSSWRGRQAYLPTFLASSRCIMFGPAEDICVQV